MKDRILKIMQLEKMTQQAFAEALCISPASLSSIFNERTSPTRNHIDAIHARFPNISINWLMFGEGEMYLDPTQPTSLQLSEEKSEDSFEFGLGSCGSPTTSSYADSSRNSEVAIATNLLTELPSAAIKEVVKYIDRPKRNIKEIRIFFDDGTYETFSPN